MGTTAHAALLRSCGTVRVVGTLSHSLYAEAAGEIVWIGHEDVPAHPRSIFLAKPVPAEAGMHVLHVETSGSCLWRPPTIPRGRASAGAIVDGAGPLHLSLLAGLTGFGTILAGTTPVTPLGRAAPALRALAAACTADDALGAADPALALVGRGPGLTPAGDDLVGGALLARGVLARDGLADPVGWARVGCVILERARTITHPISAALLGDMIGLDTWGPIHALLAALARRSPPDDVDELVNDISMIGATSGREVLAGVLVGLLGEHALLGLE